MVFCFFRRRQATHAGKKFTRINPRQTASSATVTHNPACLRAVFHHIWPDGAAERSNIQPKVHCTSGIPCLRFTLPSRHPFTASSTLHRRVRWRDILRTGKRGTNRDRGKRAAAPGCHAKSTGGTSYASFSYTTFNQPLAILWLIAMCDYFYVEFQCGHHAWLVRKWCHLYEKRQRPCSPSVVDPPEFWNHRMCSKCKPPGLLTMLVRQRFLAVA